MRSLKLHVVILLVFLMASFLMVSFCESDPVVYPDYIYFGGDTAGTIWKVQESDMAKVAESPTYGGNINAIAEDNHYLYIGGETADDDVWKIQKYNMAKAAESVPYDDRIRTIVADDDYIYVGGGGWTGTYDVWKIQKSDMVKDANQITYGGTIYAITIDDDYIYVGGAGDYKVWKIQKSDMSKVGESLAYGGRIQSMSMDDTHIYIGGMTTNTVWKVQKSDMAKVDESANRGAAVKVIATTEGDDYIYAGGDWQRIDKLQKSDMAQVAETAVYANFIHGIADAGGDYFYFGGAMDKVWKVQKSDMSKIDESADYGDTIHAISAIIETEPESIPLFITIDNPPANTTAGATTIEATVEHFGLNDLYNIPVYCYIYRRNETSTLEDFETDNGSYTASGTILWEWGVPSVGPGATHSGTKCWGTVLDGQYETSCDAYLDLPSMTVVENESISFWHWYALENNYDWGIVKISDDGGESWTTLYEYSGSNGAWAQVTIDLSDYEYSDVIIRFHLDSDESEVDAGWYIDDVMTNISWDSTPIYSESTTTDVLAESTGVATFTPAWDASNGIYNILLETFLTGEEALVNNNTDMLVNVSGSSNVPPNITCVFPANNSIDLDRIPQCYVCVNDTNLDVLSVSFYYYNNSNGIWMFDYNETGVLSGSTVYWNFTEADEFETPYRWGVIVNDGIAEVIGNYSFTTNRDTSDTKNYSRQPDTPGNGNSVPPSMPSTPGFETISILIAIAIIFSVYRKRKNK